MSENVTSERTSIDSSEVARKLPHEMEHLEALQRMRMLESYYRWTFDLLKSHLGRRVLDAGCGVGNFTALVEPQAEYVMAADLSPENISVLRERFAASKNVEVAQADLDRDLSMLVEKKFDTIVCLDVMEHVEDDISLFKRMLQIVQPGGHLLVKVPACPWLFGSVDVASDHFRRYTPTELKGKSAAAGWQPIKSRFMNISGVLPYWLKSRVLKKQANFSRTFKPWQLSAIRTLVPILRGIDVITGPVVGQSAILIARKP